MRVAMQKGWLLLLLLLGAALAAAAQPAAPYAQLAKLVETPGALFVQDSLWLDEAEVANIHYLEYLHFLRQDSTEAQYRSAQPDTTVWGQLAATGPYVGHYLRYPGFRYYPVVGVSWAQARRYCRWRSAMVNQRFHSAEYLKQHPQLRKYRFRVEYRLPTVREWELAAAGGLDPAQFPYGSVYPPAPGSRDYRQARVKNAAAASCLQNSTTCPPGTPIFRTGFNLAEHYYGGTLAHPFNCPALDELRLAGSPDAARHPEYIYAYSPNPRGLYNLIGNVAELTATPGVAKGGSFWQSVQGTAIQAAIPYLQAQRWLGFRCACTVYIEALP